MVHNIHFARFTYSQPLTAMDEAEHAVSSRNVARADSQSGADRPWLGECKLSHKRFLGGRGFNRAEIASEKGGLSWPEGRRQPLKNRGISEVLIYEMAWRTVGGSV
jgi:hypothetical protein